MFIGLHYLFTQIEFLNYFKNNNEMIYEEIPILERQNAGIDNIKEE